MKIHVIYFSPTHTSAKIAKAISGEAADYLGAEIVTIDVTTSVHAPITLPQGDFAIFCAPVYGGHIAPIAKSRFDFLKGTDTPCAVIALYGNRGFEYALSDMGVFATEHGFIPVAAAAFVGEHSYSTPKTPIALGRPDTEDLAKAAEFGRKMAEKVAADNATEAKISDLHDLPIPEQSVVNFKKFVMEYSARQKAAPKQLLPELNTELCTRCGVCVSVCPTQAIDPDTLAADPAKCIKCCACVKSCPEGARTLLSPFAPVISANYPMRKPPLWTL